MLPIKKIYIDSRLKSSDSVSHSDFYIDLPVTFLMPEDTGFYVEDVCIPVSWWMIEDGKNDTIYWMLNSTNFQQAILTPGDYTTEALAAEIKKQMNAIQGATPVFDVTYLKQQNAIQIAFLDSYTGTGSAAYQKTFQLLTDNELRTKGLTTQQVGRSVNDLLKNYKVNDVHIKNYPFTSGYVDMNPYRNLYLCCTGLGNFNTMSLTGERNIIKKIPIDVPNGSFIFNNFVTGNDYLDCSQQTLSRMHFMLKDVFGNTIDLKGNHISFSLVFSRIQNGT